MYVRLISTYLSIMYIKFVYGNSKKLKFIWERQAYTTSFQKVVLFDSYVILDLAMYNVLLNTVYNAELKSIRQQSFPNVSLLHHL